MPRGGLRATPDQLSAGGKRRRLRSVGNVRAFVANVLRAVEDQAQAEGGPGLGDPLVARVLIHGAQVLATIIRDTDLEERVARIERGEHLQREAH